MRRRRRLRGLPPGRGEEHVRDRAAAARLPDRADGQVPQRLLPVSTVDVGARSSRRAGRRGRWPATAYREFNYNLLSSDGRARADRPLRQRAAGLPDRRARRARAGVHRRRRRRPASRSCSSSSTYAPHAPYTPAPRDARPLPRPAAPRDAAVRRAAAGPAPAWLLDGPADAVARSRHRPQLPQARAVRPGRRPHDRRAPRRSCARLGVAQNTYVVFSSDNGFHMGQRRLTAGKQTAWDHDIRVPLIVVGPGVPPGATVGAAGGQRRPAADVPGARRRARGRGRGPQPRRRSCAGTRAADWRTMTLIEHHGATRTAGDPDCPGPRQGKPPSYEALRFADALYVAVRERALRARVLRPRPRIRTSARTSTRRSPPTARPSSPPRSNRCTPARAARPVAPRTSRRATS